MMLGEVMFVVNLVKKWRAHRRRKKMLSGKLTYTAIGGLIAVQLGKFFGVEVAEGDIAQITEAVLAVVAIYGRWRATRAQ